ncbi:hypothetical protein Tco_1278088 [Tanacetum coccineum]
MAALPICDELRRSVNSSDWVPQFILRCHREISDDVRLGTEINALCARLTVIVDERANFVNELDMLEPEFVPVKMAELMKQIQDKDIQNLMKLQILGTEFEIPVFYLLIDMANIGTHCDVVMSKVLVEPRDMQLGRKGRTMDRRPMITELRSIVGSSDWTEVLRYFYRRAAAEDRGFAMRMNLLREEIADVCEYRRNLADELCSVRNVIAPVKAAELLNDTLTKDEAKMAQLRELERQLELRALEKELFIQKLVRNVPF